DTTAEFILNTYKENKLEEIFLKYGEENWSRKIAKNIIEFRRKTRIKTTEDLKKIVESSIPRKFWPPKVHPSFRIFQAIRIEVNKELAHIENGISNLSPFLSREGIFCVISFHSLEDRIVKNCFKNLAKEKDYLILTKKPMIASEEEILLNPASRSAKLRVLQAI
ncbi:MAG: 16S rRNA (cytosine(1402)-N(4))-methyltransferase RsmH, partial [Leptospiraceae bacterium]|nr:16S rRNA (cytosine(1402)-N(4))-methyltransferase RsmH [Leptospiraceae bacterium]